MRILMASCDYLRCHIYFELWLSPESNVTIRSYVGGEAILVTNSTVCLRCSIASSIAGKTANVDSFYHELIEQISDTFCSLERKREGAWVLGCIMAFYEPELLFSILYFISELMASVL